MADRIKVQISNETQVQNKKAPASRRSGGQKGPDENSGKALNPFLRFWKFIFRPERPLFTISLVLGFVAIVALIVYLAMQIGTVTYNEPLYRMDNGLTFSYEGTTRIRRTDDGFFLRNAGAEEALPTSPIYFENRDAILLADQMVLVRPELENMSGKTGYFMEVVESGGKYTARIDRKNVEIDEGFLFDGMNMYVFLEPTTISWRDQSIELEPFSYAIVHYNLRLEIYPLGGEPVIEQTGEVLVEAQPKGASYSIDLSKDILRGEQGEMLLFTQPSLLNYAE